MVNKQLTRLEKKSLLAKLMNRSGTSTTWKSFCQNSPVLSWRIFFSFSCWGRFDLWSALLFVSTVTCIYFIQEISLPTTFWRPQCQNMKAKYDFFNWGTERYDTVWCDKRPQCHCRKPQISAADDSWPSFSCAWSSWAWCRSSSCASQNPSFSSLESSKGRIQHMTWSIFH